MSLEIKNVSRTFAGKTAVKNITLSVKQGEFIGIIGTSGCGKSTLLRAISGLDQDYEGEIAINGHTAKDMHDTTGFIFQEPRLFPWLTVLDNVLFGLKGKREEKLTLGRQYLEKVGLRGCEHLYPRQLSGGMAQRVAIARALVTSPEILLLDEPFSALDAFTKMQLQDLLLDVWQTFQSTIVLVTHDIDEATYLCDRIVILRGQPGEMDRELTIKEPRPRARGSQVLAEFKEEILESLDLNKSSSVILEKKVISPVAGTHNLENYDTIKDTFSWDDAAKEFSFWKTGKVNAAYETIDRHVDEGYGGKIALHYVNGNEKRTLTFKEVKEKTDHYATVLKNNGVKKGDRVFVFLPKTPECYISILAIIKLGAIAGPLFEAFMADAVKDRMNDCNGSVLITDKQLVKRVPQNDIPSLHTVLFAEDIENTPHESINRDDLVEWVDLDDGLLIHYTSGSTGKPKGVLHAHRAMIHHYISGKWVLDVKEDDVFWCTSHPGWVTGSVYGLLAPWLNRATIVIQGGRFQAENWYQLIDELKVTIWYSAPTAFRMLLSQGDVLKNYDLSSLRHVLSVGEPLNPEVIYWVWEQLGVRIHDTWWMTETGGHLIVNLPAETIKPGSMGRPFPGITVGILDEKGEELPRGSVGQLAIRTPWPGLMKDIWGNKDKFAAYFKYKGWYVSGDLAFQDEEGYVFFQSRSDDIIHSAGERIGPFEVESKLIEHPAVAEAGVIGKPDPIRGEIVKAFITLRTGYQESKELLEEIRVFVRNHLAAHAAPREIEVMDELPKTTLSGKILRRKLKEIEIQRANRSL